MKPVTVMDVVNAAAVPKTLGALAKHSAAGLLQVLGEGDGADFEGLAEEIRSKTTKKDLELLVSLGIVRQHGKMFALTERGQEVAMYVDRLRLGQPGDFEPGVKERLTNEKL